MFKLFITLIPRHRRVRTWISPSHVIETVVNIIRLFINHFYICFKIISLKPSGNINCLFKQCYSYESTINKSALIGQYAIVYPLFQVIFIYLYLKSLLYVVNVFISENHSDMNLGLRYYLATVNKYSNGRYVIWASF